MLGRVAAALAGVPVRVHTFHGHVFEGYFPSPVNLLVRGIERALAAISDRIIVLYRGREVAVLDPTTADEQDVLLAMQGGLQSGVA